MPRSYPLILIALVAATVIAGALIFTSQQTQQAQDSRDERLTVAATIQPLSSIATAVAGNDAHVIRIAPPGASPHTFEVTPGTLRKLRDVEIIFAVGHNLDSWVSDLAGTLNGATVVTVDRGIALRSMGTDEPGHEHDPAADSDHQANTHNHHGHTGTTTAQQEMGTSTHSNGDGTVDPHYWLHFGNARQITNTIANTLASHDREHADAYRNRAAAYERELAQTEQALQERLASLPAEPILTLHGAWGYFADNFDLTIAGSYQPVPAKQPSPQYLAALRDQVQKLNASVIFTEPQLGTQALDTFAQENNLAIAPLDPIGGVAGRETYIELMRYNVASVVDALKQQQ